MRDKEENGVQYYFCDEEGYQKFLNDRKIIEGRTYLDTVLQEVTCKNWYYGHYHKYYFGSYGDIIYRGLGIMEFYQHQKEDISYAE